MVYSGKNAPDHDINQSMAKVIGATKTDKLTVYMMEPLLNMGYHLYVDNYYTSLKLLKYLNIHKTSACGTIRQNRIPGEIKSQDCDIDQSKAMRSCIKYTG